MTILSDHQSRLWQGMLQLVEEFQQGKLSYYEFVGKLESALDAGEFKDRDLIDRWYDVWTPLEIARAQMGNSVNFDSVGHYVSDMKNFLKTVLDESHSG